MHDQHAFAIGEAFSGQPRNDFPVFGRATEVPPNFITIRGRAIMASSLAVRVREQTERPSFSGYVALRNGPACLHFMRCHASDTPTRYRA